MCVAYIIYHGLRPTTSAITRVAPRNHGSWEQYPSPYKCEGDGEGVNACNKIVYHLIQNIYIAIKLQFFAGILYISSNSVSCTVFYSFSLATSHTSQLIIFIWCW